LTIDDLTIGTRLRDTRRSPLSAGLLPAWHAACPCTACRIWQETITVINLAIRKAQHYLPVA
jgi:hypothetical protein